MNKPAYFLHRLSLPWLILVVMATILPHGLNQPLWLMAMVGLVILGTAWRWKKGYTPSSRILKIILVFGGMVGIFLQYRTLIGRDAGVAILTLLIALKLLELKQRRDAMVVILLACFMMLTQYFYGQGIGTGVWLLATVTLIAAALIHLHGNPTTPVRVHLKFAGQLVAQALPLMLVLYLLFPRIPGPLWGLPLDAHAGMTGLSGTMSPGAISKLVQSAEIAFRAEFTTPIPDKKLLYWRGPVLDQYDGREWKTAPIMPPRRPLVEITGPLARYTLTLEPHNQRWLLPLDLPAQLPQDPALNPDIDANAVMQAQSPVRERLKVSFMSSTSYRLDVGQTDRLQHNLQLPTGRNPRTQALARQWKAETRDAETLVERVLDYFRTEKFFYTLSPPRLGQDAVDDFLFESRRGFCEHYASSFVVILRAAGVPARVVTGYQGGEPNPVDGFVVVRQSDAHAWAEVWLKEKGWVRVDPTAAIAPERVESGIGNALPAGEPLPRLVTTQLQWLISARNQWEAVNNRWNQWILGYDPEQQQKLLSRFGLGHLNWQTIGITLTLSLGGLILILAIWIFRPEKDPDIARVIWKKAIRNLNKRGIICPAWESPLALAARLSREAPQLAPAVEALAKLITAARYSPVAPDTQTLQRALKNLTQHP